MAKIMNPWEDKGFPAITINGEQYFTVRQVANIIGRKAITVNQMMHRGKSSIFGGLPTTMFPDIMDIRLIKLETMFTYPFFRERGFPSIKNGKAMAQTFDKNGARRTVYVPIQEYTNKSGDHDFKAAEALNG